MLYAGKPHFQVPSRRYKLFIDKLSEITTEMQEKFKKIEAMQLPYLICKESLEHYDFPNDISFELNESLIDIHINMVYDDRFEKFIPLIETIGKRLKERELIKNWEPNGVFDKPDLKTLSQRSQWTLLKSKTFQRIVIMRFFPVDGTCEYKIEKKYRKEVSEYTTTDLTLVERLNNNSCCGVEQSG